MCQTHVCYIVPPYLLTGIAESKDEQVTQDHRHCALQSLHEGLRDIRVQRAQVLSAIASSHGFHGESSILKHRSIVPEDILRKLSESEDVDEETRRHAKHDLEHLRGKIAEFQSSQLAHDDDGQQKATGAAATLAGAKKPAPDPSKVYRSIHDAKNSWDEKKLPGAIVRLEGQPESKDSTVNAAYDNAGVVLKFFKDQFNWNSIDGKGMQVKSTVHFGVKYENAFWASAPFMQMVYGDGNEFLHKFAECVDVVGHELGHAITEHTSPLEYFKESGALNEHVSDVYGIMVKQFVEQETAEKADWLIGEGCLLPGVKGVALRNMKAPGTAYDDKRFGKDPQPDHVSSMWATEDDQGGVHLFSGIPNRAFVIVAQALGGFSWERAGKIWWTTMSSGRIPFKCNFRQFADVTVEVADELYGEEVARTVRGAWNTVGVVRKTY